MATLEDLAPEARDELALLARELSENPDTRKSFLGLTRKVRPNMPVPELDLDARIVKVTEDAEAKVAAMESKLHERDMRAELERRRQSLKDKGLARSDDDVAAIEKVMLERGIQNHETAADYWNWMSQAATPTPTGYRGNVLDKDAQSTLKDFWKNPAATARNVAQQALDEVRKRRA